MRIRRAGSRGPIVGRWRLKLIVSTLAAALFASVLSAAPIAVGPANFIQPAAAQAPSSTYCENIDDSDPANGPTANGGGTAVDVTVNVADLETGADLAPSGGFSYLVSLDNTARGDDPDTTRHPSVHPMQSHSPTVAAGDEVYPTFTVPNGCRYLITVRAPGHALWGEYVELPAGTTGPLSVDIDLLADAQTAGTPANWPANPDGSGKLPIPRDGLPLTKLVVQAFEDSTPTNGQPDFPGDVPLAGFDVTVSAGGEAIIDVGGSPLCTDIGGDCKTDADGLVTIEGLPPGPYEVHVIPPDGQNWVQTTTIEGTQVLDVWLEAGSDGLGIERALLNEPGATTGNWFGFIQVDEGAAPPACGGAVCGEIKGRATHNLVTPPGELTIQQSNEPISGAYVAINNIGVNDNLERVVRADADGNFSVPNLAPGEYQVVLWDEPLLYIIGFYTVVIPAAGGVVDMGDTGVFRWFAWLSGYVYLDSGVAKDGTTIDLTNTIAQNGETTAADFARNGIRDCYDPNPGGGINPDPYAVDTCELGLPGEEVLIKFRDGSVFKVGITDGDGFYEIPDVRGPLGRYVVPEVGFARRDRTGHSVHHAFHVGGGWDPYESLIIPGEKGGDLLLAAILWEGNRTWVDWGKANYDLSDPEQNGGIAGAVLYGTTINEVDPALAGQEPYEPGVPNVPLRLWGPGADTIPNNDDDVLLVELSTDAWSHPGDGDGPQPQTVWAAGPDTPCNLLDQNGATIPDPNNIGGLCLEVPANGNETQDGAWDGGFAFEEDCSAGIAALNGGQPITRLGNLNAPAGSLYDESLLDPGLCGHLVPGDFVAQVLVPDFYQIVKEESVNTDEGIELQPQLPPPGCVGDLHDVLDPRSPTVGSQQELCDLKLVRLLQGQNAAVEFTIYPECPAPGGPTGGGCDVDPGSASQISQRWINDYTGNADEPVPIPGRYYGFSEDGLRVDNDPTSLTFGAGFGVPNIPIGIYDFTGRHLTTVFTDVNGYYEFLAPSSYTVSAPTPAGLVPGMWKFVPNDPGPDPATPNPTYNPTYLTQPWLFQALPGKMRLADTPLFPVSNAVCQVEEGTPELFNTSDVYKFDDGQPLDITLTGTAFEDGTSAPMVELIDDLGNATLLNVVSFTPSDLGLATPVFEDVAVVTVPGALAAGHYQLEITADNVPTVNGVSFHVLPIGTNVVTVSQQVVPDLSVTGPLQVAIDGASPGTFIDVTTGTYRENLIVDVADLTIQGHGPGGLLGNAAPEIVDIGAGTPPESPFGVIPGSVIDSRFFLTSADATTAWDIRATAAGVPGAPSGATVSVLDADDLVVDGLGIGFGRGAAGGGVWANEGTLNLTVSNNLVVSAVGEHGGGVVLGRPDAFGGSADQNIDNARITDNRIIQNGGVTFAGGIGIFAGSDNYVVADNDVCGNYGLEYGGGISHFGTSNNGVISGNRVYYNDAFDEGGGIMIAGELRSLITPTPSGDVLVDSNEVSFNLTNDDGGGIRLLAPLDSRIDIVNNFVNHNVATDHGGGIALDNASDVFIINNTIVENVSTSTAIDSEAAGPLSTCAPVGANQLTCPRGAGLTATPHRAGFAPADGSTFSDPVVRNNIFWNNEAFSWNENGLGLVSVGMWDLEVVFTGTPGCFDVENSFLSVAAGPNDACNYGGGTNSIGVDPQVNTDLVANGLEIIAGNSVLTGGDRVLVEIVRGEEPQGAPATFFIDAIDMHLTPGSPAIDAGIDPAALVAFLDDDIDGDLRPLGAQWDVGADEATAGAAVRNTYISVDCGPLGASVTCGEDVDILRVDGASLVLVFDGTDVLTQGPNQGQSNMNPLVAQIDGFAFLSDTEILVSFQQPLHRTMFGLATGPFLIDDSDVMLFTATQLGGATAGTWSWYFDGSDVGLGGGTGAGETPNGGEDVDAVGVSSTGGLLLSTINTGTIGVDSFDDSDVFEFTFSGAPGETTAGTVAGFFDGSAADGANGSGLAANPEDVNAFSTDPVNDDLYVSTIAQMVVNENQTVLVSQDDDISACLAPAGDPPECSDWQLWLDGASVALEAYDIKGLEVWGNVLP